MPAIIVEPIVSYAPLYNYHLCHSTGFSNDGTSVCALSKQTNKHKDEDAYKEEIRSSKRNGEEGERLYRGG